MDSQQILDILIKVGQEIVRPRFRRLAQCDVEQKKPGDFVTVADREAEVAIAEELRKLAPDALLVGEEACFFSDDAIADLPNAPLAFTIDPIDGTRNFVNQLPTYAMMVAEVRQGQCTRGWIWHPEYEVAYVGEAGKGVFRNGEPVRPLDIDRPAIGAASNAQLWRDHNVGEAGPIVASRWCAGFDYVDILEHKIDYMYYKSLRPWDHLPGTLFVRECGGVARLLSGEEYGPATTAGHLVIARNEAIWRAAAATLPMV